MTHSFTLDNTRGTIDNYGWIQWHTINCHVDSLQDTSELKQVALSTLIK